MIARRGYALMIVLLVLALLSVGLGTLLYFLEASAETTNSMLERRRVFYACDGIGRAATVLAQRYMLVPAPSTPGLINFVCTAGGGGCCASPTGLVGSCDPVPAPTSDKTAFTNDPAGAGPSAMPTIVPTGFKLRSFSLESVAKTCLTDAQCVSGTCVSGRCRTVGPLPNGPFEGMNARQDVISIALRAEHVATSRFACQTEQTLTLGKIAMFQFFLFSDMPYTDWHPGPVMRATGRMHANGDLAINPDSPVFIERVTASGDLRCMSGTGIVAGNCAGNVAMIANRQNPDMFNATHFTKFKRTNATWAQDAITNYASNAQDRAHNVPRLALPVIGSPAVQRGRNAANAQIANTNIDDGVAVTNSRLLIDPPRAGDTADVLAQKFASKADIRIINGVWYLRNPANAAQWPGVPIWSDHAGHYTTKSHLDFSSGQDVGQGDLEPAGVRNWLARTPQRFSYYGAASGGSSRLTYDLDADLTPATLTPPFAKRAVVSYGALFRDASAGQASAVWRPGARSLARGTKKSFCGDSDPGTGATSQIIVDALNLQNSSGGDTCAGARSRAEGLLAAARTGFRNGYSEFDVCGSNDAGDANCGGGKRASANILPLNFDVAALQEALADNTPGELGSYFCAPSAVSCAGSFMGAPFNGIVYIGAPYPQDGAAAGDDSSYRDPALGSERGYGSNGGVDVPHPLRTPKSPDSVDDSGSLAAWGGFLFDNAGAVGTAANEKRDDEIGVYPAALCSESVAGSAMATSSVVSSARPACPTTKATDANVSFISGVRIINARRINTNTAPTAAAVVADAASLPAFPTQPVLSASAQGQLPNGLTIATNLPLYVVGDVNMTSDAWATDMTKPWVPVLLAGDTIHPLSNAWDDLRARWALSTASTSRPAMVTRYNMEVLAGWGMTVSGSASGGIHNFPRFLEDWGDGSTAKCQGTGAFSGGCPAIILGSMVIGHHRVYTAGVGPEQTPGGIGRSPPRRDWGFDRHLDDLEKQPPGAPVYDVAAIQQWNRN